MTINTKELTALRKEYGEAFYLLDSKQFRANFLELKNSFSAIYPNFNLAYSYKTNYTPKLCRIADELGGYAEVVSETETELALRCGVKPKKIIWNGPVKDPKKLETYLLMGVTVNIDSLEEAVCIRNIADRSEKELNVGIRCNFDIGDGEVSRFGFDVTGKDFFEAVKIVTNSSNLHFVGFQCHFAKRTAKYWPARAKGMTDIMERTGIIPERIDLGGGLYGKMPESLAVRFETDIPSYKEYAEAAATVLADYFKKKNRQPELILEPGSALVGDCMKFAGTVESIKNVRGKWIATMLGSQKNISMERVNPPVEVFPMGKEGTEFQNVDIVGYTCIENDVIFKGYAGRLAVGDMVLIGNCGSYSLVMKPPFILPNFPVLDIGEDNVEVIKRAETFEDIFHTFNF